MGFDSLGLQIPSKKVLWGVFRGLNTFLEGIWSPRDYKVFNFGLFGLAKKGEIFMMSYDFRILKQIYVMLRLLSFASTFCWELCTFKSYVIGNDCSYHHWCFTASNWISPPTSSSCPLMSKKSHLGYFGPPKVGSLDCLRPFFASASYFAKQATVSVRFFRLFSHIASALTAHLCDICWQDHIASAVTAHFGDIC